LFLIQREMSICTLSFFVLYFTPICNMSYNLWFPLVSAFFSRERRLNGWILKMQICTEGEYITEKIHSLDKISSNLLHFGSMKTTFFVNVVWFCLLTFYQCWRMVMVHYYGLLGHGVLLNLCII